MGRFQELLSTEKQLILHGALGTELEFRGFDVSGKLWSAKYLLTQPKVIQDIHMAYLLAGADIITTSSYQASIPGLKEAGLSASESHNIIRLTVKLAKDARDSFWHTLSPSEKENRLYPLISGDIGPYAAYLADGSEYNGSYGAISKEELKDFHRPRIKILLEQGVDLLALETLPNLLEIQALKELLEEEFPQAEAYMSFTAQTTTSLSDGSPIEEAAKLAHDCQQVLALGINCSPPSLYPDLLKKIAKVSSKAMVTYPNSGEIYDGQHQTWTASPDRDSNLLDNTLDWQKLGAKIVGGCCRTRPSDIKKLRQGLLAKA